MHIARIQVEEGFLDGLDLSLPPGLVTIIGARGTGKTSIIELLRFALGVVGYTPELSRRSNEHALSVLGSGQVTVTIVDGARTVTASRTAQDEAPRISASITPPIIFSQTEIENIGLQPGGRMRLLDGFVGGRAILEREEAVAAADARSLTVELSSLRQEIDELEGRRSILPSLDMQIASLAPQEAQLVNFSEATAAKSVQLSAISTETSIKSVATVAIANFVSGIEAVRNALAFASAEAGRVDPWPIATEDLLANERVTLSTVSAEIANLIGRLDMAREGAATRSKALQGDHLALEEQARALRREIDELQAGAGTIMRQAQQLRERKAQLEALNGVLASRKERLNQLVLRRDEALDRLEGVRARRYDARSSAIAKLNEALGPRIRLSLTRCGQFDSFAGRLADILRGSGLRYSELSQTLSQKMSPRELMEAVEQNDIDLISDAAGITSDRAVKLVSALKETDLGGLATIMVEDDVCFELLDGKAYKDIAELSTGQRCTVVLPIILQHRERLLVVDQPEDHIDNAFIADTLIKSINERSGDGQIVFSTHNANIPVLGGSDLVVEMGSDGKRGYIKSCSPLDAPESVGAITDVMEGGEAAFQRRADFYGRHSIA